jgi:hypothetical protein
MFYPTGKTTGGRVIICKCCNDAEISEMWSKTDDKDALEAITEWLNENQYCMEAWQLKDYLSEMGYEQVSIYETVSPYMDLVKFTIDTPIVDDELMSSELADYIDYDDDDGYYVTDRNTFEKIQDWINSRGHEGTLNLIEEDMGAAAPAAPAAGFATLGTVQGMGNPATPTNTGTNASFYNPSAVGSGDRFDSITVGTPAAKGKKKGKKNPIIKSFDNFLSTIKKMQ